ncbi:T6SS immunity protein Tli4 family protein [Duganella radicis]|uniref:Tle cognate immunity protein 4 C-terminal domain-containing protein n=1 Tax=Duganella radicis TaxID=551988 RepID=A0A6L6PQZ3_9BURK|nr:T6SS immunity protein Tli4 family protein [Duganella radicis]MTV41518.1 hypothetical protein [Duganella radicis]
MRREKNDHITHLKTNSVMKTQCIGHSLVDLPDGYSLKSGASAAFTPLQDVVESARIDVRVKPAQSKSAFVAAVKARQAELADAGHGDTDKLTLTREMPDGAVLYRVNEIADAHQSEIHWLLRDQYLTATIHSYKNQAPQAEELLFALMKNIALQQAPNDMAESFCFSGLSVSGKYRAESATLRFRNIASPDVAFSIDVNTFRPDDAESLLQRVGGSGSLLRKFQAGESVLRKGELTVAGMQAQEWGASIKLGEEEEKQLDFTLETMRPVPSPAAPKIHFEMTVKGDSAKDESQALALWDRVTRTIRPR